MVSHAKIVLFFLVTILVAAAAPMPTSCGQRQVESLVAQGAGS